MQICSLDDFIGFESVYICIKSINENMYSLKETVRVVEGSTLDGVILHSYSPISFVRKDLKCKASVSELATVSVILRT